MTRATSSESIPEFTIRLVKCLLVILVIVTTVYSLALVLGKLSRLALHLWGVNL